MKRGITAEFDYKDEGITISKKKRQRDISDIAKQARELGLSYGQFMAKKRGES